MAKKPLVGLNADYRPSRKEGPALSYLAAGYYNAIQAAGGIPVILPPMEEEDDLSRVLDMLQTVVREDDVSILTTRSPLRVNGKRARVDRAAPRIGEHSAAIREEFGL